jgi:hypothetical protein
MNDTTLCHIWHFFIKDVCVFFFWFLFFGCVKLAAISEDMVKDGYQNIMNIDISAVVVEAMTAKYKDIPQLKCEIFFEF